MAISVKEPSNKIVIDIMGQQGNANSLLHSAQHLVKSINNAKKDDESFTALDHKAIQEEMTSGDYNHLVRTFEKHFGHVVTLEMTGKVYNKIFG